MHCPIYSHCLLRRRNDCCPDESREYINRLLDDVRFDPNDYYDFIKYETTSRLFQRLEMLAQRCLKKGKVRRPPVPTDLISLADEQHPIEISLLPLKAYHGGIWRLREGWVIQLKDSDTSASQRFTLFHEAFHILAHCHCRTTPVFRKRGTLQGCFNEMLADYFAICVLMPREWVKEKWAEVNDLERMAEIFVVPKPAMWLRLRQLNLI